MRPALDSRLQLISFQPPMNWSRTVGAACIADANPIVPIIYRLFITSSLELMPLIANAAVFVHNSRGRLGHVGTDSLLSGIFQALLRRFE